MRHASEAGACAIRARATLRLYEALRRLPTMTATDAGLLTDRAPALYRF
jgi:hypothetical protein